MSEKSLKQAWTIQAEASVKRLDTASQFTTSKMALT